MSSEVTHATYQQVPVESFAEVLLRTGKLTEAQTQVFPTTEGKSGCDLSAGHRFCLKSNECGEFGEI